MPCSWSPHTCHHSISTPIVALAKCSASCSSSTSIYNHTDYSVAGYFLPQGNGTASRMNAAISSTPTPPGFGLVIPYVVSRTCHHKSWAFLCSFGDRTTTTPSIARLMAGGVGMGSIWRSGVLILCFVKRWLQVSQY